MNKLEIKEVLEKHLTPALNKEYGKFKSLELLTYESVDVNDNNFTGWFHLFGVNSRGSGIYNVKLENNKSVFMRKERSQ
jgi:hypothetical protein